MRGSAAPSPAERLLAEIYQAGYASVEDFIDRLRVRPRAGASPVRVEPAERAAGLDFDEYAATGRHAAVVDPFTDTVNLYLDELNPLAGVTHSQAEADGPEDVDPCADTTEFPAIQRIWVIPERHAS